MVRCWRQGVMTASGTSSPPTAERLFPDGTSRMGEGSPGGVLTRPRCSLTAECWPRAGLGTIPEAPCRRRGWTFTIPPANQWIQPLSICPKPDIPMPPRCCWTGGCWWRAEFEAAEETLNTAFLYDSQTRSWTATGRLLKPARNPCLPPAGWPCLADGAGMAGDECVSRNL